MSHFTVLVVASDVDAALQPFHEFECTGTDDQYVQDIDRTAEALAEFNDATVVRYRAPDGLLHDPFDGAGNWKLEFSKEGSYGRREGVAPDGWEQVDVPSKDHDTAAKWISGYYGWDVLKPGEEPGEDHKYGRIEVDSDGQVLRCIDRTNPNKKWDWWQIGGRWHGNLITKDGRPADQAVAGDVDFDAMISSKATEAAATWDSIHRVVAGRPVTTWDQFIARVNSKEITIDEARAAYRDQPVLTELEKAGVLDWYDSAETLSAVLANDRDTYVKREGALQASTWALLHNGEWTERGSMGWFACSDATDATTAAQTERFWTVLRALPPDALLTVVDCHI